MAAKKKPLTQRTTLGESYSGQHRALKRPYRDTAANFDAQDALARRDGITWSQWARAILRNAVARRK